MLLVLLLGCRKEDARWLAFLPEGEGFRPLAPAAPPPLPTPVQALPVDLDADGVAEVARVDKGRFFIERDGRVVWTGPAEWLVVDLAAGDVEGDLRQEVLLALWKADETGTPRSHPFIVGHRHGRYDLLWGGSAVTEPIVDLDLGDVDGDGRNELVVLVGAAGDPPGRPARTVTLWRWNGWGFTQVWRSEAGVYRRLYLLDVDGDGRVEMVVEGISAE